MEPHIHAGIRVPDRGLNERNKDNYKNVATGLLRAKELVEHHFELVESAKSLLVGCSFCLLSRNRVIC